MNKQFAVLLSRHIGIPAIRRLKSTRPDTSQSGTELDKLSLQVFSSPSWSVRRTLVERKAESAKEQSSEDSVAANLASEVARIALLAHLDPEIHDAEREAGSGSMAANE